MVNRQGVQRHWVRRAEPMVILVASIFFSLVGADSIWWYCSVLNGVDPLRPYVTVMFALACACTGFVLNRGLAHRIQNKQPLIVALCICALFELVEIGCCFAEAAHGLQSMDWIQAGHFEGFVLMVLQALPYIVLPISPILAVSLGYFDVSLHIEKHGREETSSLASHQTPVSSWGQASRQAPVWGQMASPPRQSAPQTPAASVAQTHVLPESMPRTEGLQASVPASGQKEGLRGKIAGFFAGGKQQEGVMMPDLLVP